MKKTSALLARIGFILALFFSTQQSYAQCNGFCGGSGSTLLCYCDDACWLFGDCCPDMCTFCPLEGPETMMNCGTVTPGGGCNTDVTICTPGVAGPFNFAATSGPPTDYAMPIGCSTGVGAPNNEFAFITLYITTSGPLNLLIQGNTGTGFLDVIIYNIPPGVAPCVAVMNSANEIGCNYASSATGCNQFGTAFPCASSVPAPFVNAGDVVMIIVNDFSVGGSDNFTLELGPGGAQTGPPDATIAAVTPPCETDAPFQLTAVDMGGDWSGTGVSPTGMFDPAAAGPGTHTITYTIGANPCDATDTESITVIDCTIPPSCALSVSSTPGACNPATNLYTLSGSLTFTAPPTTGTLTVTNSCGGSQTFSAPFTSPIAYSIPGLTSDGLPCTVTAAFSDSVACTATSSYTAPVNCIPPCNISAVTATVSGCSPVTNTYTVSGNITFTNQPTTGTLTITNSCGGAQTFSAPFTSPQAYSITGVPAAGGSCTVTAVFSADAACTNSFTYTAPAPPVITSAFATPVCVNESPFMVSATPAGGVWTGPGISTAGSFDPSAAGPGTHILTYVATAACPLSDSTNIMVNALPTVSVSASPATICNGDNTTLTVTGTGSTFSWSPSTGLSSTTTPTTTASPTSNTTYTVTVTDAAGCANIGSVTVAVSPDPLVTAMGPTDVCLGQTINLVADGADTYTWSPAVNVISPTSGSTMATPTTTTTYTVTGTNAFGCSSTATVTVVVHDPTASVIATPETGNVPLAVSFDNNSNGTTFIWDFGNGLGDTTTSTSPNTSTTYDTSGTFTVTVVSIVGFCFDTLQLTIVVNPLSSLIVPNIITANGDGVNDEFKVIGVAIKSLDVQIFNRWGQKVGSINSPAGSWSGRDHAEGTYYYLLRAEGEDAEVYEMNGNFSVVK